MRNTWVLLGILILLLIAAFFAVRPASADPTATSDADRIQRLEEKIKDLEAVLADPEGTVKSTQTDVKKLQKLTLSGYAQLRYQHNQNSESGTAVTDDFYLRRARLKLTAKPSNEVAAVVSFDGAKGFELKDAFVTYIPGGAPERTPSFSLGQMNLPFGREVPASSSVRACPERALFARILFPGERDLGFKVTTAAGQSYQLELGVYNGAGINKRDADDGKDLCGRLSASLLPALDVGVSGYWGTVSVLAPTDEAPARRRSLVKNRFGADLRWLIVTGLTLQAEGVYARERGANPWGYLVQLAKNLDPRTELIVRFDAYDHDHDGLAKAERTQTWDVGLIRHLTPNLKGKVFFEAPKDRVGDIKDNRIISEVLVVF